MEIEEEFVHFYGDEIYDAWLLHPATKNHIAEKLKLMGRANNM